MASSKKEPDEIRVRPFADFLQEQSKGRLHEELSSALHDLIGGVKDHGKKGELILRISISPNKKNPDVLEVTDQVAVKAPLPERKASIFYTDRDGNLSRKDPAQLEFDGIREVPAPTPAAKADTTPKENRA